MKCLCGSTEWTTLGVRKKLAEPGYIYLVNCARCKTTSACSKENYQKIKDKEDGDKLRSSERAL